MSAAVSLAISSCLVPCLRQAWIGKAPLRCTIFLTIRAHCIQRLICRMILRQGAGCGQSHQKQKTIKPPTRNKEKKEKRTQKKVRKKNKKGSRSHNTVFEPPSSSISDHFALPEELTAPLHTPADTSTSSSQVAPRPHRRSTACAKLLVRAGLR